MASKERPQAGLARIVSLTFPILLGYLSIGFIYGVFGQSSGYSLGFLVATSAILYAGSSQFLLLNLLVATTPLSQIFMAVFFLNMRHVFYYKPVAHKMPSSFFKWIYCVFTLSDESFAILTEKEVTREDSFAILYMDHFYWIAGTLIGALFGNWMGNKIEGLDFSLVALFTVLLLEKIRFKQDQTLLAICFFICLGAWLIVPLQLFLITVMFLTLAVVFIRDRKSHV